MDCPNALCSLPFVDTVVKHLHFCNSVILRGCRGTNPAEYTRRFCVCLPVVFHYLSLH